MATVSTDEGLVSAIKEDLRGRGFYLRYTEWPSGHQVMLHPHADTHDVIVTDWFPTELEAWRDALRLADERQARPAPAPAQHQGL